MLKLLVIVNTPGDGHVIGMFDLCDWQDATTCAETFKATYPHLAELVDVVRQRV